MALAKSGAKFATHSESTAAQSEQDEQHIYSGVLDSFFEGIDLQAAASTEEEQTMRRTHTTWCDHRRVCGTIGGGTRSPHRLGLRAHDVHIRHVLRLI